MFPAGLKGGPLGACQPGCRGDVALGSGICKWCVSLRFPGTSHRESLAPMGKGG